MPWPALSLRFEKRRVSKFRVGMKGPAVGSCYGCQTIWRGRLCESKRAQLSLRRACRRKEL